jgi:uncharacterized 2Fe-2S/4Fe-4S cluster protein (DUF4445 family)
MTRHPRSRLSAPSTATIIFQPQGHQLEVSADTSVLDAALSAGLAIESLCAGQGTCGKCRIRVMAGDAGDPTAVERQHLSAAELAAGLRLACQVFVAGSLTVSIPEGARRHAQRIVIEGALTEVPHDPAVTKVCVTVAPPTIENPAADAERLLAAGGERAPAPLPHPVARDLPTLLAESNRLTVVLHDGRPISIERGDTTDVCYGMAFDIGTTTVVGYLIDLTTGSQRAVAAAMNPQVAHGDDVISRIQFAGDPESRETLTTEIIEIINRLIGRAAADADVGADDIYEITAVGNTTMTHLALDLDPSGLGHSPYAPVVTASQSLPAASLGIAVGSRARLYVLPAVAGYVGADTVGVILATGMDETSANTVAVDIGTNGEVVVAAGGRILVTSTAAGPAFEGARISQGMRAADGAIERVEIGDDIVLRTVEGPPRGICGSGLIDAVAELVRVGAITESGQLLSAEAAPATVPEAVRRRLRQADGATAVELARAEDAADNVPVLLTQHDVRELQLAKGALAAGIRLLLSEVGVAGDDIEEILLAGAFGNYVRKESAVAIGLLPDLPLERIRSVGNAAGAGARLALTSRAMRARAEAIARRAEHVELSFLPQFYDAFTEGMTLGRWRPR